MKDILKTIALSLIGFSVSAGPWFEKSNYGGVARHRASSFAVGNKGYLGLGHINSGVDVEFEDWWEYDPASDSWTQKANYPEGKCYHATCFVIDNIAYVGTGRLENVTLSKKFFKYDPQLNVWTPIADLPGLARRGAVGFSINGKGYVGTGQTTGGYASDFFEYNPTTNQWIIRANLPGLPRTAAVGFSIGDYGYLGTGNTTSGSSKDFYQFNPVTNQWIPKANVGLTNRQEAVGFAVNGMGYIGTGDDFSSGNNFGDMWEYDPALNTWIQIEDFAGTARRYLTAFVIGTKAYAGTGTNGTNFRDFWLFDQILSVLSRKMDHITIQTYPNPSSEKINFNLGELPEYIDISQISVSICTLSGQILKKEAFNSTSLCLSVEELPSGSYIYLLQYNNETFKTGKLIHS